VVARRQSAQTVQPRQAAQVVPGLMCRRLSLVVRSLSAAAVEAAVRQAVQAVRR